MPMFPKPRNDSLEEAASRSGSAASSAASPSRRIQSFSGVQIPMKSVLPSLTVWMTGLLIMVAWGMASPTVQAQTEPVEQESADQQPAEPSPETPAAEDDTGLSLRQLQSRIRANERKINVLYGSLPVGLPEKQRAFFQEIDKLTAENQDLEEKLQAAALASLDQPGPVDPLAARLVFNQLVAKLDPPDSQTHFDPQGAMDLVDRWLSVESAEDLTVPPAAIAYQGFRASFALLDLEKARQMLGLIEASGVKLQPTIVDELDATVEKWQREQQLQQEESAADDLPRIELVLSTGTVVVELFENQAPQTVANFVSLVESGFYDGLEFFAVKPGEYARVGCPQNDGTSEPDYRIADEWDREDRRHHMTGTLTMFHEGPGTAGTQFLITHQPNSRLDGRYTAFGRVHRRDGIRLPVAND